MKKLIISALVLTLLFALTACGESLPTVVKEGSSVIISYVGTVDGVAFERGTGSHNSLVIGSGGFIPGFEEQLIGMNLTDQRERTITVTFPDPYPSSPDLEGKEAQFFVTLHGINP
jgi:trigger factor